MNIEQARFNMIQQQVRTWNVLDDHVLDLLEQVKREDFCPAEHRSLAFMDLEIPLPCGQVMLAPRVQARLVQDLQLKPTDRVLQIGAGSGYLSALLGRCAGTVLAYDIHPELAEMARANLARAGVLNVNVRAGDGFQGALSGGPFDAIVLCGSVPAVPHSVLNQLALGGRLIAVVGSEPMMRAEITTRESETSFSTTTPWDINLQRLENIPETGSSFRF